MPLMGISYISCKIDRISQWLSEEIQEGIAEALVLRGIGYRFCSEMRRKASLKMNDRKVRMADSVPSFPWARAPQYNEARRRA